MKPFNATLLDMAVRETFKKTPLVTPQLREKLLAARKFVLSESMSAYGADMTCAPFLPFTTKHVVDGMPADAILLERHKQRGFELLEAARHLARAPHALTWIEYDSIARRRRTRQEYRNFIGTSSGTIIEDDNQICPRVGWLIEQHPGIPTAFNMILFQQMNDPYLDPERTHNVCAMMPFAMRWVTDDENVLPWEDIPMDRSANIPSEICTGVITYHTDRVGLGFAPGYNASFRADAMSELIRESVGELRLAWMLLATINDVPVVYDTVRPTKGYVAKGKYRRFSEHTVITLNIPSHRSLKTLAARVLTNLRRRAHHVRGFWRIDWRHPPASQCEPHDWVSTNDHTIKCARCDGRKFFIAEHVRGDASRGFVLHDYNIEKGVT